VTVDGRITLEDDATGFDVELFGLGKDESMVADLTGEGRKMLSSSLGRSGYSRCEVGMGTVDARDNSGTNNGGPMGT
jgi:hypothetical protein